MDINKYVGNQIKKYRKQKKLSQAQLGELLGVSQNTVSGYEKGEFEVSYDNLFKIAQTFDISINDLFPPTESNQLQKTLELDGGKDFDVNDMQLMNEMFKRALKLDGDDRKKVFDSMKVFIELAEKADK